jgi:ribonuclease D
LHPIVTTDIELAELISRLESVPVIGLDTEFLRERTYRAELCLVQLASADLAVCVDPLAVKGVSKLGPLLGANGPIKVMHASRQDLEVLCPDVGLTQPVFDTQVAAALTGLPSQIGYGDLVKRMLGKELSKAHTRTDWSRRPLSDEQVEYALDDVRYLIPLKEKLEEELARLGRLEWLREELEPLTDIRSLMVEPEQAWLRVKGLRGFDEARTRLARSLAAWRERRAIERNRPRGWILEDTALREIVARVPRTLDQLASVPELPGGVIKHCGEELLECVRLADVPNPPPPLPARSRPDPTRNILVKKLSALNQTIAAEVGVSPEVLATRRDLEQLADGALDAPVLQGWRKAIVGERLLAAL